MRKRPAHVGMAATLLVSATIGACGASVETTADASGATGSGGSTATSATSASTTAVVSSSAGTGGGPAFCGGKAGIPCAPGEFCAYDPPGSCGNADGGGLCKPSPAVCTTDCPGVCGCNGQIYCNACEANAAGVDVSATNTCSFDAGAPAIYSAEDLFTNVSRFAIYKADPARDLCFRLIVEGIDGSSPLGITTPAGWSVGKAEVTDNASDCKPGGGGFPQPPLGAAVQATGGGGKIDFPSSFPQCFITIHASLSFPKSAPWVPANEPLDADMLPISGGCPK